MKLLFIFRSFALTVKEFKWFNAGSFSLKSISLSIDNELYPLEASTLKAYFPSLGKSSFIKSFKFGEGPCHDFGVTSFAGNAELRIIPSSTI